MIKLSKGSKKKRMKGSRFDVKSLDYSHFTWYAQTQKKSVFWLSQSTIFLSSLGAIAQWLEQRTHNPLVVGSNPTCPTFSTTPPQQSFSFCASVTQPCHYATFTHSTGLDWNHPAQIHSVLFLYQIFFYSNQFPCFLLRKFINFFFKCVKSA